MSTSFKLSIPKPCDANWDQMNPEENSRHCDLCSQSVYSLEEFEESEVVDLLQQKVCVRIKANPSGQIKTRRGFSSMLLLGGLLACGETPSDPEVSSETEQSVEVLQVTSGGTVKVDLQEGTPKAPPPPVMGKIAPPTLQKKESIQGEVDTLHEELGEPMIELVDKKSATIAKEDCATDEARN